MSRVQDSSTSNPKMTVYGKMYHYLGALIRLQHSIYSNVSVYVYDFIVMTKASVRRSNVTQQVSRGILADLRSDISQ